MTAFAVVLHDVNAAARLADRIVLLQAGRLRDAYGVEIAVGPGPDRALVVVPPQAVAP